MTTLEDAVGLLNPGIGDCLRDLAAQVPADQAIVEIGSYKGKSTAYLAAGAKAGNGAPVFAVDAWDLPGNVDGKHRFTDPTVRQVFEDQLRALRLWSRVTPIQAFSVDAADVWDGPMVGLLFIDADHAETSVRSDFEAWLPHLAPSHVVAFDDIDTPRNPGVRAAVDALTGYQVDVVAAHLAVCRR
jgi:predicted O-methyltransferase YrrM